MCRCIICEKELEPGNGELCPTCKEFVEWKHKGNLRDIKHFKDFRKFIKKWRSSERGDEEE